VRWVTLVEALRRKESVAAIVVILATLLGAVAGAFVGHRQVSLETVIHSWQKSEAQLYFTGPYGEFSEDNALRVPIDMGSNRIRFPLDTAEQRGSLIQRLDPCSCNQGIALGRIGLRSPFAYDAIGVERWTPSGGTQSFRLDSTMVSLQNAEGSLDPQVLVYAEIENFATKSAVIGGFLGGAIVLLAVSFSIFVIQRLRAERKARNITA
jgi:hypothetical protein